MAKRIIVAWALSLVFSASGEVGGFEDGAHRGEELKRVLEVLERRNACINSFRVAYAVSEFSTIRIGGSPARIDTEVRFDEMRDRSYKYEVLFHDEITKQTSKRVIMSDDKKSWHLRFFDLGEEAGPPTVTVGSAREFRTMYEAEAQYRDYLGDAILSKSKLAV